MKTLNNLKIKHKLLFMASLFCITLIGISITTIIKMQQMNNLKVFTLDIKNLQNDMLTIRKAEKDFIIRDLNNPKFYKNGISKNLTRHKKAYLQLKEDIDLILKIEILSEFKIENNIKKLKNLLEDYNTKFSDYTFSIKERGFKNYGLISEMRKAIHNLEKTSQIYYKDKILEIYILTMRRIEKDYFLRKDIVYYQKLTNTFNDCKKYIIDNYTTEKIQQYDIIPLLEQYSSSFSKIIEIDKQLGYTENEGLQGDFRSAVGETEPIVNELFRIAKTEGEKISTNIINLILWVSILSLIIVLFITFFIINNINSSISQAKKIVKEIAKGDFTVEFDVKINDEIGELLNDFKITTTKLQDVLISVRNISDNIAIGSSEIKNASQQLNENSQLISQGACEQAASTEEISTSMEEMLANVQQNTDNALQTEEIANRAAKNIIEGNNHVKETVSAMKKIVENISIIGEIAIKTDLLAINAAIEAARVQQSGKSFAVVATEIRKLSVNSKKSANKINDISTSSVKIANKSGELLNLLVPEIQKTSQLVQEISSANQEQNASVSQINNSVQQLTLLTQQYASTSEELSASSEELFSSSEELSHQANDLNKLISFFKVDEDKYIKPESKYNKHTPKICNKIENKNKIVPKKSGIDLKLKDKEDDFFEKF